MKQISPAPHFQHRLKTTQGDRLVTLLQAKKCGGCEPSDLGELNKRQLATVLSQELGEFLVEF